MSVKGGYKVLDFKNVNFTVGTEKTVAGAHEALENNYKKPIILQGLNIGGTEYSGAYVNFQLSGTSFVGVFDVTYIDGTTATATVITITDTDGVTITNPVINGTT